MNEVAQFIILFEMFWATVIGLVMLHNTRTEIKWLHIHGIDVRHPSERDWDIEHDYFCLCKECRKEGGLDFFGRF